MIAVKILTRWGVAVSSATVALVLLTGETRAQQPALVAPVATAAVTPATAAQTEPKKLARRAGSKCRGLDEMACGAISGCTWIAATKTKTGKEVKAYCRTKPKTTGKPAAPAAVKPGEPMKK
jgi:hypothetical protein